MVREGGVEPPHPFGHTDLNRARLPIPPLARAPARLTRSPLPPPPPSVAAGPPSTLASDLVARLTGVSAAQGRSTAAAWRGRPCPAGLCPQVVRGTSPSS